MAMPVERTSDAPRRSVGGILREVSLKVIAYMSSSGVARCLLIVEPPGEPYVLDSDHAFGPQLLKTIDGEIIAALRELEGSV